MEKDTVILSLDKYNELRDFKQSVLNGEVYCVWTTTNRECRFYTKDKVIKDTVEINDRLDRDNIDLRRDLKETNQRLNDKIDEIGILSNMNNISTFYMKKQYIKELSWIEIIKIKLGLKD